MSGDQEWIANAGSVIIGSVDTKGGNPTETNLGNIQGSFKDIVLIKHDGAGVFDEHCQSTITGFDFDLDILSPPGN